MIVQEDFLKKIRSAFNLNIYEAKIWTALLSKGLTTAGDLADISGVPRSRSYDVLESLEKRGFVIVKLGKPIKYIAIKPEEVVKRVKDSIQKEADYQLTALEKVKVTSVFHEIELLHKQGIVNIDPTSLSGAIKGRTNIKNQMATMIEESEKTITMMTTPTGLIRKFEEFKKIFKRLKDKGVKIRILTQASEELKDVLKDLKETAEVRYTDHITGRFLIVDGKQIMFMVNHDKNVHESYDTGIWANTPYFASAMEQMFNATWTTLK